MAKVDLSSEMPPVGSQGNQGSCVAWSVGYYDKTHTEYVEHKWDVTEEAHQISPAFIYNQINGGDDRGSGFGDAFRLICEQGACMWSDFPYHDTNYTFWPSESAFSHGILYRGTAAYYIGVTTDAGIAAVKQRLANGQTCVLGVSCYSNLIHINDYDTTYTVHDKYGTNYGGHGVCIVGYDDDKVTNDGTGAFRLVNSWGTGWGNKGYWWMSYYAVKTTSAGLSGGRVYYADDRTGYNPTLLGRVQLTHSARDCIGIKFGIGRSKTPSWTYDFRKFGLLNLTARPFPDNNLVFDLSDGAPYLEPTDSVYVQCVDNKKDNKTGAIQYLSAEYLPWHRTGVSPQTPVAIPDFKKVVMARLKIPKPFGLSGKSGTQGEPLVGPLVASQAEFRNGAVSIAFELARPGAVRIAVYDATGRTLAASTANAQSGRNELTVKLPQAGGVYFYRLESGSASITGKLAAIR